jgi:hypothetical protein
LLRVLRPEILRSLWLCEGREEVRGHGEARGTVGG